MISVEENIKRIKEYRVIEVSCMKMSLDDFNKLCKDVTEENAWVEVESGEWFWVMTEEGSEEECIQKIEEFLNISIKKIFVDINNNVVFIQLKR